MGKRSAESRAQEPPPGDSPAQPASQPTPQPAAVSPSSAGGMSAEAVQRLQELADLHKQGVLTDEEFAAQKALILA
jgi:Short C-terminal domain